MFLSSTAHSKKLPEGVLANYAIQLFQQKQFTSSAVIFKQIIKESSGVIPSNLVIYIDKIVNQIGLDQFQFMDVQDLKKVRTGAFRYLLARHYFNAKNLKQALFYVGLVNEEHKRFYLLAQHFKGLIFSKLGMNRESLLAFQNCTLWARGLKGQGGITDTLAENYDYIHASCLISIGRMYFKMKQYPDAQKVYERLPQSSYKWPHMLLELAWTYYQMGDYNSAIGRVLAYRSPILQDYFFSESEYLLASSFMELCQYDEVLKTLKDFDKLFLKDSQEMIFFLKKKRRHDYYLKMALESKSLGPNIPAFITRKLLRLKNVPGFVLKTNNLKRGIRELKMVKSFNLPILVKKTLHRSLFLELKENSKNLNRYIKKNLYYMAKQTLSTSRKLGLLRLELESLKKENIYNENSQSVLEVSEVEIRRSDKHVFWKYHHEFWGDEIGNFVWSKRSQCL
jgi:hypothetical protein